MLISGSVPSSSNALDLNLINSCVYVPDERSKNNLMFVFFNKEKKRSKNWLSLLVVTTRDGRMA
jgi:hypothetical protein